MPGNIFGTIFQLIKRIHDVDPMVCPSCGGEMKVIAFITEYEVVDAILRHLERNEVQEVRANGTTRESSGLMGR